jgi:type IV secretory pathway TraG/TraD family ATPase VirD4
MRQTRRSRKSGPFERGADTFFHAMSMKLSSLGLLAMFAFAVPLAAFLAYSLYHLAVSVQVLLLTPLARAFERLRGGAVTLPFLGHDPAGAWELRWQPSPSFTEALVAHHAAYAWSWLAGRAAVVPLVGAVLLLAGLIALKLRGDWLGSSEILRGARIVTGRQLAIALRRQREASDLVIGGQPLVKGSETQHICLMGGPGSGKSVGLMELLDTVARRGEPALVFDPKPELIRHFHNTARGDLMLNPLDGRVVAWSPWAEIKDPHDYVAMAQSWVPEESKGHDPFFTDAARILAAGLLETTRAKGDVVELARLATQGTIEELLHATRGTSAAAFLSSEAAATRDSIRTTLGAYSEWLRWLRPDAKSFSIRSWVRAVAEPGSAPRPWLWLTSRGNLAEVLAPLLRIWIEAAVREILSGPVSRTRRLWLVLDEFPSLGRMRAVEQVMAQGRGHGAVVVLGLQSISQLRDRYGVHGASTLLGQPSTHIILRQNEPDAAQWASQLLGEAEMLEPYESMHYAAEDIADAITLGERVVKVPVVLPSELLSLPVRTLRGGHRELAGYARLAGSWPVARIAIRTRDRPETAPAWIDIDTTATVDVELRRRRNRSQEAIDPSPKGRGSEGPRGEAPDEMEASPPPVDGAGQERTRSEPDQGARHSRQHQLGL